jgi:SPP1 family predicted phage head-tail adaptor
VSTSFPAIPDVGRLDRRIGLSALVTTTDEYGEVIETWVPIGEVWSERRDETVREVVVSGALAAIVVSSFRIRYRKGLTETTRVHDLGQQRDYDVVGIEWLDRDEGLLLRCQAVGATAPLPSRGVTAAVPKGV